MKKKLCVYIVWILFICGCVQHEDRLTSEENIETGQSEKTTAVFEEIEKKDSRSSGENTDVLEMSPDRDGLIEGLKETWDLNASEEVELYNALNKIYATSYDENTSMFCVMPDSGISYFVNQEEDYYLYRIKHGEIKLAVELPVMELCPFKNKLYFMLNSYEQYDLGKYCTGDIFSYTPADGSVELVYKMEEIEGAQYFKMAVDESGIYFRYIAPAEQIVDGETVIKKKKYNFHVPFDTMEAILDENQMTLPGTSACYLQWVTDSADNVKKMALVSRNKEDEKEITYLSTEKAFRYCVSDGKLFYTSLGSTAITEIDLLTKEIIRYDFFEIINETMPEVTGQSRDNFAAQIKGADVVTAFNVLDKGKYLWACVYGNLYCVDTATMEVVLHEVRGNRSYKAIYSDGYNLYGILLGKFEETGVVRICTDELLRDTDFPIERYYFKTEKLALLPPEDKS